jgi:hypothetical protein
LVEANFFHTKNFLMGGTVFARGVFTQLEGVGICHRKNMFAV